MLWKTTSKLLYHVFKTLGRRSPPFAVTIFSLLSILSAHAQVPAPHDLQILLKPPALPLLTAPVSAFSLQARLQKLSQRLETLCQKKDVASDHALACLWPRIILELDHTMTALARNSPDADRITLTLAARLHPADFFSPARLGSEEIPFDALFARFLISQRLIRDSWPAVDELLSKTNGSHDEQDRLVEAWLTTSTPWSFALRAMRSFSCVSPYSNDCEIKRKWGEILEKSVALVNEDEILRQQVSVKPQDFTLALLDESEKARLLGAETQAADQRMHDLLLGVFEGTSKNYLLFAPGSLGRQSLTRQIRFYLDQMDADSLISIDSLVSHEGSFCEDYRRVARNAPHIVKDVTCRPGNSRENVAKALEVRSSLYRFSFLQIRSSLALISRANRGLSQEFILARQRERALRDILETKIAAERLKLPSPRLLSADQARLAARPLVIYLYDMIDGTESP